MEDGSVGCRAGLDIQLFQQAANADATALVADPDPDRAILVMDADRDHRPFEPRIADAGHGEQ
jgi:hypothetical protein